MSIGDNSYVLISSAYNEENHIGRTIESVIKQTVKPVKWLICSDGSTDKTDDIIKNYAQIHGFINYLRVEKDKTKNNFGSKVSAINLGYALINDVPYSYIGNIDADVSFGSNYFEKILLEFNVNKKLGIGGGIVLDLNDNQLVVRSNVNLYHVSGAIQLFRRQCYEEIGGYVPIAIGGEDTVAVVMARMKGWEVEVFPRLKIFHHKNSSATRGYLLESYRDGAKDYALGSHPLFQIAKSLKRIKQKPYFIASIARILGYFCQYCRKKERPVNEEFVKYYRSEQSRKLKSFIAMFANGLRGYLYD